MNSKIQKNTLKGYDNIYLIKSYYTSAKAVPLDADSKTVTTKLVASAAQQPALVFTRKIESGVRPHALLF